VVWEETIIFLQHDVKMVRPTNQLQLKQSPSYVLGHTHL